MPRLRGIAEFTSEVKMKETILALAVFFSAISVDAKTIEIDGGAVAFNAPDSFTELTSVKIRK